MSYIVKPAIEVQLQWMLPGDLDAVVAIEKSLFGYGCWTKKKFLRLIKSAEAVILVAWRSVNGCRQVLGYMVYENSCRFHFEVTNIAVAPAYQRYGIGTKLIGALQAKLRRQGRRSIAVNVWEFDEDVIRFFRQLGFQAVAVLRQPLPDVEGDGYRFVCQLGNKE